MEWAGSGWAGRLPPLEETHTDSTHRNPTSSTYLRRLALGPSLAPTPAPRPGGDEVPFPVEEEKKAIPVVKAAAKPRRGMF
ncbi:hypothetical protein RchiOBHm_Chr7g0243031 [Rosa chinensis]|uniref:Uncharacterized protein n=1 Tax=Rosa chinensis TaxID=74649 RepID=A0A2P6PIN9_ROSCH|nr:hypothetical protein RchiOBHm_Chr7g0243031 [Rosa chinensis]